MPVAQKSLCRSCKAEIIWATNAATGNLTCLDFEKTPDGTFHVIEQLTLEGTTTLMYEHGEPGGHTSHFATCPQANEWRQ